MLTFYRGILNVKIIPLVLFWFGQWKQITYDANLISRFKIIKRCKTKPKWIKLLETPYPQGFNDNIYHIGNLSKIPDFDVFSMLEFRTRRARLHGIKKNGNSKRKSRVQKLAHRIYSSELQLNKAYLSDTEAFVFRFTFIYIRWFCLD